MDDKIWQHYTTVLTNGRVDVEAEISRFGVSVTPPPNVKLTIKNGQYYINGRKAWLQVKIREDKNGGS